MKPALYLILVLIVSVFFLIRCELLENQQQVYFINLLNFLA